MPRHIKMTGGRIVPPRQMPEKDRTINPNIFRAREIVNQIENNILPHIDVINRIIDTGDYEEGETFEEDRQLFLDTISAVRQLTRLRGHHIPPETIRSLLRRLESGVELINEFRRM
jgi:ribosomal protein S3AE